MTTPSLESTIDETLAETFPASDPPAWTLGREPHRTPPAPSEAGSLQTANHPETARNKDANRQLTILGIAGSLRQNSYNRAALRAAQLLVPPDATMDIFNIVDIPLFNQDAEQTLPPAVVRLKQCIRAADAILIATPEYNYSFPGVLKNAIDWASRPPEDNAWRGKPVALMGASMGRLGTARAQYHLRQVFVTLNMHPLNQPEIMIGKASELFDEKGELVDTEIRTRLQQLLAQLVQWTRELQHVHK